MPVPPGCPHHVDDAAHLDFSEASLQVNNLGGLDGRGAPYMYFHNIGHTHAGNVIDLEVSNLTEYVPATYANTKMGAGGFGQINLAGENNRQKKYDRYRYVDIRFTFLDARTHEPMVISHAQMTFFDFDTTANKRLRECINFLDEDQITLTQDPPTEIMTNKFRAPSKWPAKWHQTPFYCATTKG